MDSDFEGSWRCLWPVGFVGRLEVNASRRGPIGERPMAYIRGCEFNETPIRM